MQPGSLRAAAVLHLLLALVSTAQSCTHVGSVVAGVKKAIKLDFSSPHIVHKGCYNLRRPEDYQAKKGSVSAVDSLTWEKCRDTCYEGDESAAKKEEVLGLHGSECWCFHQFKKSDQTVDKDCNLFCAGNKRQSCGGRAHISVYGATMESD